ncbi:MAG: hypothetical protein M0Z54_09295 [Thermaerobacter sp.]|nr:hypothetical protein [Thermaerobacter sp.]
MTEATEIESANPTGPAFDPEIVHLIDQAAHLVEDGTRVPLTGRTVVDGEGLLALLDHMRQALPEDIRRARWVLEECERVLAVAQQDAEAVVEAGRARAAELTAESTVLRQARAHAEDTMTQARERALEMRAGARGYADDLLARAESGLKRLLEEVQANRAQLGPPA